MLSILKRGCATNITSGSDAECRSLTTDEIQALKDNTSSLFVNLEAYKTLHGELQVNDARACFCSTPFCDTRTSSADAATTLASHDLSVLTTATTLKSEINEITIMSTAVTAQSDLNKTKDGLFITSSQPVSTEIASFTKTINEQLLLNESATLSRTITEKLLENEVTTISGTTTEQSLPNEVNTILGTTTEQFPNEITTILRFTTDQPLLKDSTLPIATQKQLLLLNETATISRTVTEQLIDEMTTNQITRLISENSGNEFTRRRFVNPRMNTALHVSMKNKFRPTKPPRRESELDTNVISDLSSEIESLSNEGVPGPSTHDISSEGQSTIQSTNSQSLSTSYNQHAKTTTLFKHAFGRQQLPGRNGSSYINLYQQTEQTLDEAVSYLKELLNLNNSTALHNYLIESSNFTCEYITIYPETIWLV